MAIDPFGVPPAEAIQRFREKGYQITDGWQDMWQEQHQRAFTVARVSQLDVLADLRSAVDDALANGRTLREFQKDLRPLLEKRGWWGEREEIDPETGEARMVQLGSPARLRTIYDTNMRTSLAAGRWEQIERTAKRRPYLRYVAIHDGRARDEHLEWDDTVLPFDDPWWNTHYPPNGWGCRCTVQQLGERDLKRYGLQVSKRPATKMRLWKNAAGVAIQVPVGISPGFAYHAGKAPRGWTPSAPAEPLANNTTYRDLGLPRSREAQRGAPPAPTKLPREHTDADRAHTEAEFRRLFNVDEKTGEGSLLDVQGEELLTNMRFLDHARGDHKPAGEPPDPRRTQYLPHAREAVLTPDEIWLTPMRMRDGTIVIRKRYVKFYSDTNELVVAHRDESGYLAWTQIPSKNVDNQRQGYLLYRRSAT